MWNLWISGTQLQLEFVIGFSKTSSLDKKFKELFNKPSHERFWFFLQMWWRYFFFHSIEGMLATIAIAVESAQNCPSLPNSIKICPKTISMKNFEIPSKVEISIFFGKKQFQEKEDALKLVLTICIFNATIGGMPFLISKNALYMWISALSFVKNKFSSNVPQLLHVWYFLDI